MLALAVWLFISAAGIAAAQLPTPSSGARNVRGIHTLAASRGAIVDQTAMIEALENGEIGAAGLDTVQPEPLPEDHPLWRMENVLLTPHVGGGSPLRQDRIVERFCENLKRFVAGAPLVGQVDKRKGY